MGSLTSRPKVPAAPKAVYVPVYTSPTPTPAAPAPAAAPPAVSAPNTPDPETQGESEGRRGGSLLERRRGVLSTVLTGFRGVLTQTMVPQRKTLLGE